jgi:MFS-type transporter involved in bile tolerance (Atg22 family)
VITTILGGLIIIIGIIIDVNTNRDIIIFCGIGINTISFWFLLNKCKLGFWFIIISYIITSISRPHNIALPLIGIIIPLYTVMKLEGYWDELT